ncbi:MAG: SIMPL domain-containing protein [Candidatus Paceibacterota bacterium]
MEQKRYVSALIISLAVVLFGVIFALSAYSFSKYGSYVEVKGLSERIVKADTATWTMGFDVKANNINALYAEIDRNKKTIESFLIEKGFESTEINMAPVNIYQDTYKDALFRYNAMAQLSLYTNKVDAVKEASKNTLPLLEKGIVMTSSNVSFEFSDINSIKPEMLSEAIQNAKTSAFEFAKASGSKVGGIARANQGVIDINEKDPGSPEYKKVRVVSTVRFILK